mmetsp:Transcript_121332/g.387797  ORF Transcript_121332/g.387797 Transcript_121332/m.387797 type:complete len:484 (-) Transcript_121332:295-1746(-)
MGLDSELEEENDDERGAGGKTASSCLMCCMGLLAFPLVLFLLMWNEKRFVCKNKVVLEAAEKAVWVECDAGKTQDVFAFFTCPVKQSSLQTFTMAAFNGDVDSNVSADIPFSFTAASGSQYVEMYQCQEECTHERRNDKPVETCTYTMVWAHHKINSNEFVQTKDAVTARKVGCPAFELVPSGNPEFPRNLHMGSSTNFADAILAGKGNDTSYTINHRLVQMLVPTEPVPLSAFRAAFTGPLDPSSGVNPWTRPMVLAASSLAVSVTGTHLESCAQPAQLGCIRLSFLQNKPADVSVLAHVSSAGEVGPQTFSGGWGCEASSKQWLLPTKMTKDEMIASLKEEGQSSVWVIRAAGIILSVLSVFCVLQPISAAADIVGDCVRMMPCGSLIEDKLEGMVDWLVCVISLNVGCTCSLLVIALVWAFMRPTYALAAVALAGCCCVGAVGAKKEMGTQDLRQRELRRRRLKGGDDEESGSGSETEAE